MKNTFTWRVKHNKTKFNIQYDCYEENVELPPNFYKMQRHLYRLRRGAMPASPRNATDVSESFTIESVMKEYGMTKTIDNEESTSFYDTCFTSPSFSYCVLASQRIIDAIQSHLPPSQCDYYLDGTFKVVPLGEFNQLVIIHIAFYNKVFLSLSFSLSLSLSLILFISCFLVYFFFSQFHSMTRKTQDTFICSITSKQI